MPVSCAKRRQRGEYRSADAKKPACGAISGGVERFGQV